jgi:SH3-like domain-containing protein
VSFVINLPRISQDFNRAEFNLQKLIVQVFVSVILTIIMKKLVFLAVLLLPCLAFAAENKPKEASQVTAVNKSQGIGVIKSGLPVPRFVSLKSREANMRVGPGVDYPIKTVYRKQNLPLEVVAEFGNWRKVRDIEGEEGWALHSLLTGKRYALVQKESVVFNLYKGDRAVFRAARNLQVQVRECRRVQCEIEYEGTRGWIDKASLWGVYADEQFD